MTSDAPVEPIDAPVSDGVHPRRPHAGRRILIEWVGIIVFALLASLLVRTFVFQTYFIPSPSMEPTLMIGDRIVIDKLALDFGSIHTGDIVVFKAPRGVDIDCAGDFTDVVKRVIGLPGERLYSVGNTIYIDGHALDEAWTHVEPIGGPILRHPDQGDLITASDPAATAAHPYVVPADHYFMMGDNHPDSCDSRFWGPVARSSIIGKAFIRIWPLNRFGLL